MEGSEKYCMKWNSYQKHIGSFLIKLFDTQSLADVTICADTKIFKCHRFILSACSPYFESILEREVGEQPVIVLAESPAEDIQSIIHYLYHGELTNISYERFMSVLKTAEALQICGLTGVIDHIPPRTSLAVYACNDNAAVNEEDVTLVKLEKQNEIVYEKSIPETQMSIDNHLKVNYDISPKNGLKVYTPNEISTVNEENVTLVRLGKQNEIVYEEEPLNIEMPVSGTCKEIQNMTTKLLERENLMKKDGRTKYSNERITDALKDVDRGMSLAEAAERHKIPRSTLYAKIKASSQMVYTSRRGHSNQECTAALSAIEAGMSLQRAADKFNIPKTVLWRKVQKRKDIRKKVRERRLARKVKTSIEDNTDHISTQYQGPKIIWKQIQDDDSVSILNNQANANVILEKSELEGAVLEETLWRTSGEPRGEYEKEFTEETEETKSDETATIIRIEDVNLIEEFPSLVVDFQKIGVLMSDKIHNQNKIVTRR